MKTLMNKKSILLIVALAVSVQACQESWLEPKPLSIFVPENVYVDRAGMESLLLVLRRGLRDEFCGNKSGMCLEIASSDVGHLNGEQPVEIHNFNISLTPTSGGDASIIFAYWQNAYGQIRNANVILNRVEGIEISEQDKNELVAEALFHRAYWYYRLVHQFGDVPFISR